MHEDISIYPSENFFTKYFQYIDYPANTEASLTCHRWVAISLLGAMLERQFYLDMGILGTFKPNQFIQIIGEPASRKSTAIKIGTKLLKKTGFNNFAPETTSKNQFLVDLHDLTWGEEDTSSEMSGEFEINKSLFGSDNPRDTAELLEIAQMYIAADEFVDFIGRNNMEFISLLGSLWDYDGVYVQRLKNSKSVYINNPTINILSGNTAEGFNQAFPPETQGQGFLSRLLIIGAENTGRKVARPKNPNPEIETSILKMMQRIKSYCIGSANMTPEAEELYEQIYHNWKPIEDPRFSKYSGRRSTHLLKLTLICAAARLSKEIHSCDIIMANTLLTYAEYQMPKAMGEFGKGKNSGVIHKILSAINAAVMNGDKPLTLKDIYKLTHNDVDRLTVVNDLVHELITTNRIQAVDGMGFLPVNSAKTAVDTFMIKPTWLFNEEIKL